MTTFVDTSVGYVAEDTFATYKAPTRWVEFTKENLNWKKNTKQGKGMRVGSRVARASRRAIVSGEGSGSVEVEAATNGLGTLWTASMGTSVSNSVSSGVYQQNHTFGDSLPSLTVQKGLVRIGGTVDPYSFLGCTVDSFEIDSPGEDFVGLKFNFDIADYSTSQTYAAPSYATQTSEGFHWNQGVALIGGTLTMPTTTAIASMAGAASVGIRNLSIQVKNNINTKRMNYGNSGRKSKQLIGGYREISGKFTAEYDQTTLRDAFLADSNEALLITFTGSVIGSAHTVFQVVIPQIRLDGDLPEDNSGDLITIDHSFTGLYDLTNEALSIVHVTSDAAL